MAFFKKLLKNDGHRGGVFDGHYTNVRNVSILSKWEFDQ